MGIGQKWLCNWARWWNTQIKVNPGFGADESPFMTKTTILLVQGCPTLWQFALRFLCFLCPSLKLKEKRIRNSVWKNIIRQNPTGNILFTIPSFFHCTELCKNIPARLREWLSEILRHSACLGWAAEHFGCDSQNLAGMFLHNSVQGDPSGGEPTLG